MVHIKNMCLTQYLKFTIRNSTLKNVAKICVLTCVTQYLTQYGQQNKYLPNKAETHKRRLDKSDNFKKFIFFITNIVKWGQEYLCWKGRYTPCVHSTVYEYHISLTLSAWLYTVSLASFWLRVWSTDAGMYLKCCHPW